jgi:cytochrome c oxidase subunit II
MNSSIHCSEQPPICRSSACTGRRRLVVALGSGLLLAGCQSGPTTLAPQGPAAQEINQLWWILLGAGILLYLVVMLLFAFSAWNGNREQDPRRVRPSSSGARWILIGAGFTALVLLGLFGLSIGALRSLSMAAQADIVTVRVTGHQWWWEVEYPDAQIITANEIHIPAGRPVRIELLSTDVIHSFWVPALHGKMDMVPGQINLFQLQADRPGEYWGLCAQFCGIQHAKMNFLVIAHPEEEFNRWLAARAQPPPAPAEPLAQQGQEVFLGAACMNCHAISGTEAVGRLGPDLTHFASRRTLSATALPNTLGNLSGWIADPQHIKPGSLMPASQLTGTELHALLAYLQTLH